MTEITRELFGTTADGRQVERYLLDNGSVQAGILTYGGILHPLCVPDRNGEPVEDGEADDGDENDGDEDDREADGAQEPDADGSALPAEEEK